MTRVSRWIPVLSLVGLLFGSVQPVSASSILIVAADSGGDPSAEFLARGFATVDYFNSQIGTPTLPQLLSYDAVLAYTNFSPADPAGLGDVLGDFVDAGGLVSIATYAFSDPWAIGGKIVTTGYSPLTNLGANGDVSGSLVAVVPGDPIFAGVNLAALTYFHNGNFAHPGLDTGATLLATDGTFNMIARSANGRVIGLNLFPESGYNDNEEFWDLIANTLNAPPVDVPEPASLFLLGAGLAGVAIRRRAQRR